MCTAYSLLYIVYAVVVNFWGNISAVFSSVLIKTRFSCCWMICASFDVLFPSHKSCIAP